MKSSKVFKSITSATLVMAMVAPMIVTSGSADAARFSAKSVSLTVGATKSVSVKGAKGKFTWKTSNAKVATVTGKKKKATIKGVGPGSAKITCTVKKGKKTTTVSGLTVKVRALVSSFAIQDSSSKAVTTLNIKPGDKVKVKGAINNNGAGSTTNQTMKWSSSDKKIATVKKTGSNGATITGIANGSATISVTVAANGSDKKTATVSVKVAGQGTTTTTTSNQKTTPKPTDKPKATATPKPKDVYPAGYVYKQRASEVQRWYKPGEYKGYKHDGYSNNSFAIWMVGFFDNEYSTNQDGAGEPNEGIWGPTLDKYKGKALSIDGEFWYDGADQETVLLQINYTSPDDYPMMCRWQDAKSPNGEADGLKIAKSESSRDKVKAGQHTKVGITSFTIPSNAVNGDKDDSTGENYGIYVYFPNKPGGKLIYTKDNTFHFKNFEIKTK